MCFCIIIVHFLAKKSLPFTTKSICLIAKADDLRRTFKGILRLLVITILKGAGADFVHEFDFSLDLFEEHFEGNCDIGWIVLDHP